MPNSLHFTFVVALAASLASCAMHPTTASMVAPSRIQKVRTTAYTNDEGSGSRNALGGRLSAGPARSAAADWSRFPVGTRFRVVSTGQEYVIDDYGSALIGTSAIDLHMNSRSTMNRWGVRHVDIEILHWGSDHESLKTLRSRRKVGRVARMIASLEKKQR